LTRSLDFIKQNWINSTHIQKQSVVINMKESDANDTVVLFTMKNSIDSINNAASTHVQKQSAVVNMKESDANDTAVLFTTKNNVDSTDNAASTHVQKQSTVINMKENDANDTTVLNTTKNNVDSADNAVRFDKFVKSVHSQQTDKSEDFTNKIYMFLYFSWKRSRFNHSKKNTISITLADQTLHYSKSLKYVYEQQTNDKWSLQRMMKVLNHCIQSDESQTTRCRLKRTTCWCQLWISLTSQLQMLINQ